MDVGHDPVLLEFLESSKLPPWWQSTHVDKDHQDQDNTARAAVDDHGDDPVLVEFLESSRSRRSVLTPEQSAHVDKGHQDQHDTADAAVNDVVSVSSPSFDLDADNGSDERATKADKADPLSDFLASAGQDDAATHVPWAAALAPQHTAWDRTDQSKFSDARPEIYNCMKPPEEVPEHTQRRRVQCIPAWQKALKKEPVVKPASKPMPKSAKLLLKACQEAEQWEEEARQWNEQKKTLGYWFRKSGHPGSGEPSDCSDLD